MSEPTGNGSSADRISYDQRAHPRMPARGAAFLHPPGDPHGRGVRVTLNDISLGGVNITVSQDLTIGQHILLSLQANTDVTRTLTVEAEVRWVASNVRTGQSRAGCSWTRQLSDNELKRFVDSADAKPRKA